MYSEGGSCFQQHIQRLWGDAVCAGEVDGEEGTKYSTQVGHILALCACCNLSGRCRLLCLEVLGKPHGLRCLKALHRVQSSPQVRGGTALVLGLLFFDCLSLNLFIYFNVFIGV